MAAFLGSLGSTFSAVECTCVCVCGAVCGVVECVCECTWSSVCSVCVVQCVCVNVEQYGTVYVVQCVRCSV
jgi:hypothetical protein